MSNFFAVEITTVDGPVISGFFETLRQARKLAALLSTRFPTRIMLGGAGGMEVK